MDTAAKIAEIVGKRNDKVETLMKEEEKCSSSQSILDQLQGDLIKFVRNGNSDDITVQTCSRLLENIPRFKSQIADLREKINHCRRRFDRPTINIGFGGKRGQGKSFLLQKFSGLSDNEVPSGSGKTVTAVRSEIFNNSDAYAELVFYSPQEFLREVIRPYCDQLQISPPASLRDFALLKLPGRSDVSEENISYLGKLAALQEHLPEYEGLLTGETRIERDFKQLRKFVAYTDRNNNDTCTYAAIKRVLIHTPFPEIQVKQLGLVDLPGLGELNPTVETRHTAGFGDEVDLVMLIRRPYGTRVDWAEEDRNVIKTLNSGIKDGDLHSFVVIVQNEGGCDPVMAKTAFDDIKKAVSDQFKVLRTTGDNSVILSGDVLSPVLDHLAETLPQKDKKTLADINGKADALWKELADFTSKAMDTVKKNNDRGFPEEEMIARSRETHKKLARRLEDAGRELAAKARERTENEELIESIEEIQKSLKEFLAGGLGAGSIEKWIENNSNEISARKSPYAIYPDNANILRVQIAEEFSALNQVYKDIADELLDLVALQFDTVLPDFLQGSNGREKLLWLRGRLESGEVNFDNIVEALNFLLEFKIEHRTQIYPRAYQPIRDFMDLVESPSPVPDMESKSRDEQAAAIFDQLSGNAREVIMRVGDALLNEAAEIHNILSVALQFFDDKLIRAQNADRHWQRFIRTFYPELFGSRDDATASVAIGQIMDKLSSLNKTLREVK